MHELYHSNVYGKDEFGKFLSVSYLFGTYDKVHVTIVLYLMRILFILYTGCISYLPHSRDHHHMVFRPFFVRTFRTLSTMVDAKLEAVPLVDIDNAGRFKYILIKVWGKEKSDGSEPSKTIVRGYKRAEWHGMCTANDIFSECM